MVESRRSCFTCFMASEKLLILFFQYGDTPLHTSARYGHAGVTRILISALCRVSDQNKVSVGFERVRFEKKIGVLCLRLLYRPVELDPC